MMREAVVLLFVSSLLIAGCCGSRGTRTRTPATPDPDISDEIASAASEILQSLGQTLLDCITQCAPAKDIIRDNVAHNIVEEPVPDFCLVTCVAMGVLQPLH